MEKKFFLLATALFMAFFTANAFALTCPPPADPSIQLTAGTNFCYYFYISKGSNSEQGTNYRIDLDLLKGGKAPGTGNAASCTSSADCEINFHCDNGTCKLTLSELYVCVNLGYCVPISINDVALIDVKAPSVFEGDAANPTTTTVGLVVYNNNSANVKFDAVYTFYDTAGNLIEQKTKSFPNVAVGQQTLLLDPYINAALARSDKSYKVFVELRNIQLVGGGAANSNTSNDSREAYFSVSKRTSATNIPETNLLLLPALFAAIAFILLRK